MGSPGGEHFTVPGTLSMAWRSRVAICAVTRHQCRARAHFVVGFVACADRWQSSAGPLEIRGRPTLPVCGRHKHGSEQDDILMCWIEVEALVRRAQKGDRAAFGELVERFWGAVYAAALGRVRGPNEAQEL